jgi:hypothetical protein
MSSKENANAAAARKAAGQAAMAKIAAQKAEAEAKKAASAAKYSLAAMQERLAAAIKENPELAKNPAGRHQGGKRRVTRKSKKSRTRSRR